MRTAIVTGASSGIGRAVSERLLDRGWRVGLIARREDKLRDLARRFDAAIPLPCDVTHEVEVACAFDELARTAGRIDLLFNNAGIFVPPAAPDEVHLSDWSSSVAVNLTGMFLCARAAFAQMRRQSPQGGRIINNGSVSAHAPREGAICYTTTKHAVTGLTKSLSLDGRPYDIACGQIDIGNAKTEMIARLAERERDAGRTAPPVMELDQVADAVLYMAELPLSANVLFQTVMATKMPFIGRG